MSLYQLVKAFALPPACILLALIFAILIGLRWRRLGRTLICLVTILFYLLAAPFSSDRLAQAIATVPPLSEDANLAAGQAIVVLAAGASRNGIEYGSILLDPLTVVRMRYAAHLYRRTKLPLLVSGGVAKYLPISLAAAMKQALEDDFAVPVTWVEDRSMDTAENARFSAMMLKDAEIKSIILVTHASDMPRALALFSATGLIVIPAPTSFPSVGDRFPEDAIPRMSALMQSWRSVYELMARAWHGSLLS